MEPNNKEQLTERAKRYFSEGHEEMYISNQFAEEGIEDELVDEVLKEIKKIKKDQQKGVGVKFLVFGLSFIAVGLLLTWWFNSSDSEYIFILWGLPITGVTFSFVGIGKILGV